MEIKDNKTGLPLAHYKALFAEADPETLSVRSGIPYADGAFRTTLLNRPVRITHPDMEAVFEDTGAALRPNAQILLGRLLTGGSVVLSTGKFLAYNELPWGEVYLTQFRGRCITRMAFGFGTDPEKFEKACLSLGGSPVPASGPCFDIPLLPRLTMRLTVWPGEEEFPPSAQILFSDNFPLAFSAEDCAVCGDVVLDAMKGKI